MTKTITITVPATTANLGAGFDCIGAALTMYNQFQFSPLPPTDGKLKIIVNGTEASRVDTSTDNLVYQAFINLYQYLDQTPPSIQVNIDLGVPLARGLGSSATAIIGGLLGANLLAGEPLTQSQVMKLAIAMEGHPDNVVPALLGGCYLAATQADFQRDQETVTENWEICDVPWDHNIVPVVAIPDFELSTADARRVLPTEYSRTDVVFNTAHLGLLIRGLATGKDTWLKAALQDKIHQPYRKNLIPGYDAVHTAVLAAGGYGMVISGAGPTLLALTTVTHAAAVEQAMAATWQQSGINPLVKSLQLASQGAKSS